MTSLASKIPEPVHQLCATLRQHGKRAWVVGGCVRDMLLDREIHDFDLCTDALPNEVQKIFPKVIPTGIDHGTVTVLLKGVPYEVTTLRGETTYSDGRRPDGVAFISDINADLARRDFTVNAIAYDLVNDAIVDPFGGQSDLENRRLRAVGKASERFAEDGLRVLRAARFVATLEMTLDDETESAIGPSLDTYRKVSAERIHDEWRKAMKAKNPSRAFEVMQRTGILAVSCPELEATVDPFQRITTLGLDAKPALERTGPEMDETRLWRHALAALDACKGDAILRLAALLHAVGKPRAWDAEKGEFVGHERIGAELCDDILTRLKFSNDERLRIVHVVKHQTPGYTSAWTDGDVRRWIRKVGRDHLDDIFTLGHAIESATLSLTSLTPSSMSESAPPLREGISASSEARPPSSRTQDNPSTDEHGPDTPSPPRLLAGPRRSAALGSTGTGGEVSLESRVAAILEAGHPLTAKAMAIHGGDLMKELGWKPGKQIGEVLDKLLDLVTESPEANTREHLLEVARSMRPA